MFLIGEKKSRSRECHPDALRASMGRAFLYIGAWRAMMPSIAERRSLYYQLRRLPSTQIAGTKTRDLRAPSCLCSSPSVLPQFYDQPLDAIRRQMNMVRENAECRELRLGSIYLFERYIRDIEITKPSITN